MSHPARPSLPPPARTRRRPTVRVAGTDGAIAAAASLELLTLAGSLDAASAAVCPPALVGLLLRRRFPVLVLLATLPSMATGHLWLAPMIAMFTVAAELSRRPAVFGCAAAVFAAAMWCGVSAEPDMTWSDHLITVQIALMFSIGPTGLGLLARTRSELRARLAELTESQERGRRLEAEQAVARERARMAREMHDTVSYHLGIIAAQAGALWATAPDDSVREDAESIRRHGADAMRELRDVVGVLRGRGAAPGEDDPGHARLADLPALVEDSRLGATLDLTLPDPGAHCAAAVERAAYRTVQEALTNVRKHAPGAPVTVAVGPSDRRDALVVEVCNGPATAPPADVPSSGFGLRGLKERTALAGGQLEAGPTGDGGFLVRAVLPLTPAPAARQASSRSYTDTCRRLEAV
ncbi:two-component sensor histidine kinase [Streptomyces sp. WAC05374]|uniref:sensor histidine kinase n=1 Tax=Streptomyces sp. WAC05374 TaxID=2487420 RepID=UPI000F864DE2|nr:histidine kinase [Streptomyces sp. WAC05374]RST05333.1 two-component sensor histidine kinase [Streptomyces sp. WAC05374]TDF44677.1 two-component sensor histidine kinase [Streptomyces sp. WAC05374]TDF59909.1 two-component sensor histidine kinase [Streptomyces sp. WAC05374]